MTHYEDTIHTEDSFANLGNYCFFPLIMPPFSTGASPVNIPERFLGPTPTEVGNGELAGAGSLYAVLRIYGSMVGAATAVTLELSYGLTSTVITGSNMSINATSDQWWESAEFNLVTATEGDLMRISVTANTGTVSVETAQLLIRGS